MYGFGKVTVGRDSGAYYHPLFLRGRPDICKLIVRTVTVTGEHCVQSKGENPAQIQIMQPSIERSKRQLEPDYFYSLPFCPPAVDEVRQTEQEGFHAVTPRISESVYLHDAMRQQEEEIDLRSEQSESSIGVSVPQVEYVEYWYRLSSSKR